jgi:hypothetical protein
LRVFFCVALVACGEANVESTPGESSPAKKPWPGRVFVIGIDGASPRIIQPLLARGLIPNLDRLRREGAYGRIRASKPILSPRIWNSIVTAKRPEKHGILHFTYEGDDDLHHLFLSTDRKVHTIWNIASTHGMKVAVVNFSNTFPPEKVNGVMVSDHLLAREIAGLEGMLGAEASPKGAVVHPESWHERLVPMVNDVSQLTDFADPFMGDHVLPAGANRGKLRRHYREDAALTRIGLEIERGLEPDLFMVLLPGIDRVCHFLWGGVEHASKYPPELRLTPEERKGGREAVVTYYRFVDALVGLLVEGAGDDDLVIVLSDHGFEAGRTFRFLSGVHDTDAAINGVIFARGPGIRPGSRIRGMSILDVTPTILTWLGLPVAEDMDGSVARFLDKRPLDRIASYDVGEIEVMETTSSGVEATIVEQLRTLGYLEGE